MIFLGGLVSVQLLLVNAVDVRRRHGAHAEGCGLLRAVESAADGTIVLVLLVPSDASSLEA